MTRAMLQRKYIIGIGLLAVCLFGAGRSLSVQPDPPSPVVARASDVEVTAEAFRARYVDYLLATGLQDRPALRRTFVDNLVATQLLVYERREGGIEQEAAYQFRQEQVRRKLLLEAYAHRALFDTLVVREAEVQAMFVRAYTQLQARHLYARTREQAEALYARLQAGESFEALAREVFADPTLAQTGGSLGVFGFDEMDPAFEDAAYALAVGEISEPVRTVQGYSIIQLEDRFTRPLLTEFEYAKRRANLRAYVLRRKQQQARSAHVGQLAVEMDPVFEEAALEGLLGQITGAGMVESEEDLRRLLAEPLVAFGPPSQRRVWRVEDFRERAQFTSEAQRAQVRTRRDLVDFVQGLVVRETMMDRARAQSLDATPAFEQALREEMDAFVLDQARTHLAAGVDVPEDSMRRYYETAPPGEFVEPARARVREILVATEAEAAALKAQLSTTSFEALARSHTVRPGAREVAGDLGWLTGKQLGALAGPVFNAAVGDVLGPFEWQQRYALFRVEAQQPERPQTYEEARPAIAQMLRYQYVEAQKRAVYDDLRARYDIDVDTDLLYALPLTHKTDE